MKLEAIKTDIVYESDSIEDILDRSIDAINENTVIAITSKVISICEGSVAGYRDDNDLADIAAAQADVILETNGNDLQTIVHGIKMPNAGLDRSNGNGKVVLLPAKPYELAKRIRAYLVNKFGINNLGVIITDSEVSDFHNGSVGFCLGYWGFRGYRDYRGQKDLFSRVMKVSVSNIIDKLASAVVLVMGEGAEGIPIVIVQDLDGLEFSEVFPDSGEIALLRKIYQ